MADRHVSLYGIYATDELADSAAEHLISRGFPNSAISVLLPNSETTHTFAHEKHTKAAQGCVTGAIIGALIAGSFGLVIGLGALFIAGLGPLAAAGPVLACMAGVACGGFVGGVIGAIVGATSPQYVARQRDDIKRNGPLLSVYCENADQLATARQALRETGARSISVVGDDRPHRVETIRRVA